MLLLEEIIMVSDEDMEIVSAVVVGFDDDKNFVVKLVTDKYYTQRYEAGRRVCAVMGKEDTLMLADSLNVRLTALPLVFKERFGESFGTFTCSDVEKEFKKILEFILDYGVHYRLTTT